MKLNINGRIIEGATLDDEGCISYRSVVIFAGGDPEQVLTVVWATPSRGGSLCKGESVRAEDGMIFTVADTSNA